MIPVKSSWIIMWKKKHGKEKETGCHDVYGDNADWLTRLGRFN